MTDTRNLEKTPSKNPTMLDKNLSNPLPLWTVSPFGERVLAWETATVKRMTDKLFGMTGLSIGLPINGLQANSISGVHVHGLLQPNYQPNITNSRATDSIAAKDINILIDPQALPFHAVSLDVIMAHHVLEMHDEPESLLREWNRVLRLDGHLVLTLFNPHSPLRYVGWMNKQFSSKWRRLSASRLRDWLQLLGLSVQQASYGVYCPPWQNFPSWIDYLPGTKSDDDKQQRLNQLDKIGNRWWPATGSVIVIVAQKRMAKLSSVTKLRPWAINPRLQQSNCQPATNKRKQ